MNPRWNERQNKELMKKSTVNINVYIGITSDERKKNVQAEKTAMQECTPTWIYEKIHSGHRM